MLFVTPPATSSASTTTFVALAVTLTVAAIYTARTGIRNIWRKLWEKLMLLLQVGNMLIALIQGTLSISSMVQSFQDKEMQRAHDDLTRLVVRLARCTAKFMPGLQQLLQQQEAAYNAMLNDFAQQQAAGALEPNTQPPPPQPPQALFAASDVIAIFSACQHLANAWGLFRMGDADGSREASCAGLAALDPLIGCGNGSPEPEPTPKPA